MDPEAQKPRKLKHVYTIEITRAMYSLETFECYKKYRSAYYGDENVTKEQFESIYCQVPLFDPRDGETSSLLDEEE